MSDVVTKKEVVASLKKAIKNLADKSAELVNEGYATAAKEAAEAADHLSSAAANVQNNLPVE